MLEMYDEISLHQLREIEQLVDLCALRDRAGVQRWPPLPLASENFRLSDDD